MGLAVLYAGIWALAAVGPWDREAWLLENVLVRLRHLAQHATRLLRVRSVGDSDGDLHAQDRVG